MNSESEVANHTFGIGPGLCLQRLLYMHFLSQL
jgi:hypothetical protein